MNTYTNVKERQEDDDQEDSNMEHILQEIGEIAHAIVLDSTPQMYRRMSLMQSIRNLGKKDKNIIPHAAAEAANHATQNTYRSTGMMGGGGGSGPRNGRVIYQPVAFGDTMTQFEEYRDFLAAQKKRRGAIPNANNGHTTGGHSGDRLLAQMRRRTFLLHQSEQEMGQLLCHSAAEMKETARASQLRGNDQSYDRVPLIAELSELLGNGLSQLAEGHQKIHANLTDYEQTILELRKETRKNPERLMSRYQLAKQQFGSLPISAKGQEVVKATTHLNSAYSDLFNELEYNVKRRDTTCLRSLKEVAAAYVAMYRSAEESFSKLENFLESISQEENDNMTQEPLRSEMAHTVAYHSDSTLPKVVFGVSLDNVLITNNESEQDVTKAFSLQFNVKQLFDMVHTIGLNTEGIFRVPGNEKFMRDVIQMIEMGRPIIVLPQKEHYIHSIAGVLKAWIRDLPEPLMTYDAFEELLPLADHIIDPEHRKHFDFSAIKHASVALAPNMDVSSDRWGNVVIASHVRHFIQTRIPREHQFVLAKIMSLLHDIAQNDSITRMNAKNIGIVFGMNVFRPRTENPLLIAANVQKMSSMVELMCGDRYEQIFQNLQIVEDIEDQSYQWSLQETQYQDIVIPVDPECDEESFSYERAVEDEERDDDDDDDDDEDVLLEAESTEHQEDEEFVYEQQQQQHETIYYDDDNSEESLL